LAESHKQAALMGKAQQQEAVRANLEQQLPQF
jgi:hypothetical protein